MANLLTTDGDPDRRLGSKSLSIREMLYANSAAKFWSSLLDEVIEDVPNCDRLSLSASCPGVLSKPLLFPEQSLQRDFDRLMQRDLAQVIQETLNELELFGGPSGVMISLFEGDKEIRSQRLPSECVDSDVFVYLMAWMLEWAAIPVEEWNATLVSGKMAAADGARGLAYKADLEFRNEHLSEGLYRREVMLKDYGRTKNRE